MQEAKRIPPGPLAGNIAFEFRKDGSGPFGNFAEVSVKPLKPSQIQSVSAGRTTIEDTRSQYWTR